MATLACVLALAVLPAAPARRPGVGAAAQELEVEHDARLEGYADKVALDGGNNAMTWLGFGFLAAIALLGAVQGRQAVTTWIECRRRLAAAAAADARTPHDMRGRCRASHGRSR